MRLIRLILTVLLSVALAFTGAVATAAAHCDEGSATSRAGGAGHHGHVPHGAHEQDAHQHDHAASDQVDDGSSMRAAGSCSHCAFCQSCASPSLVSIARQVPLIETGALEKTSFTQRVTQFFADFPDRPPRAALA